MKLLKLTIKALNLTAENLSNLFKSERRMPEANASSDRLAEILQKYRGQN